MINKRHVEIAGGGFTGLTVGTALAHRQRPISEHTQLWSPVLHPWMFKQRRKPSEFFAYGTENQVRWMPSDVHPMMAAE
jgi:hypothetical protein